MSGVELAPRPAAGPEPEPIQSEPKPARRLPFSAVLGALCLGAVFWSLGGLETHDESWFLQVAARVAGGESLYRDVFYPTTPLAVDATLPFVWLFGAQALWVKTLVAACFAASLFLLVWIGRRSGATNLELAACGVVLLVLALPVRAGLYQPLAAVLLLGCLAATLAWCGSRSTRTLALAGALAGLSFATKQNVGVFAVVALLLAVLLAGGRLRAVATAAVLLRRGRARHADPGRGDRRARRAVGLRLPGAQGLRRPRRDVVPARRRAPVARDLGAGRRAHRHGHLGGRATSSSSSFAVV